MGRPETPTRDGSPVREFAFWLRDLRNRSGLTYEQLAKSTHYGTSTLQAATSGQRLPTLKVVVAFVQACDGDVETWTNYWTQVRRVVDPDAPSGGVLRADPPWTGEFQPVADGVAAIADDLDSWYVESFKAVLRLDTEPVEAIEQRVVVAVREGVGELSTSICVPRHHADGGGSAHELEAELLHGGRLVLREQPYETFFRNVIALPSPLGVGERHEYALRLRLPAGQAMASHYVHVPFRRSESFELTIRFDPEHLPKAIWSVSGVPNTTIYERHPPASTLQPDRFGEIRASYRDLRVGLGYGLCWLDES
jgi:transcriptional regulator with XRE-family HTH domain